MSVKGIMEKWPLLLAYGHIAAGIAIPLVTYSSAFDHCSGLLQHAFWPAQTVPAATIEFQRWFAALFGPTIAWVGVGLSGQGRDQDCRPVAMERHPATLAPP